MVITDSLMQMNENSGKEIQWCRVASRMWLFSMGLHITSCCFAWVGPWSLPAFDSSVCSNLLSGQKRHFSIWEEKKRHAPFHFNSNKRALSRCRELNLAATAFRLKFKFSGFLTLWLSCVWMSHLALISPSRPYWPQTQSVRFTHVTGRICVGCGGGRGRGGHSFIIIFFSLHKTCTPCVCVCD